MKGWDGYLHLGISVAIQHTNAYIVFYLKRLMDISRYVKINTPQRCASYLNKYSAILIFFLRIITGISIFVNVINIKLDFC